MQVARPGTDPERTPVLEDGPAAFTVDGGRSLRRRVVGFAGGRMRRALPGAAYRTARSGYRGALRLTRQNPGRGRLLPDFLVIGAAKSGTTTLYGWLIEHPFVEPATMKEVHYFDYGWFRGEDWYRSHFPLARDRDRVQRERGRPFLTGEASPTYISHPWAPGRLAATLPHARLIVALRNPIDRAYSQFQMSRREGEEPLESFADAIAAEEERLRPEIERVFTDQRYNSWPIGCWGYLLRSRYAEQIERWLELVPREQFLFVSTETMADQPLRTLHEICDFLDLPRHEPVQLPRFFNARYDAMPAETRAELGEYFRPHNERLYELVGVDFGWDE